MSRVTMHGKGKTARNTESCWLHGWRRQNLPFQKPTRINHEDGETHKIRSVKRGQPAGTYHKAFFVSPSDVLKSSRPLPSPEIFFFMSEGKEPK